MNIFSKSVSFQEFKEYLETLTKRNRRNFIVANYDKIFLYLYTPECSYCEKFNPNYEKVFNKHLNKCRFVKVNANTKQGNELMRAVNGYYVPFVLLIDSSTKQIRRIEPNCLLNLSCVNNAVENLVN